MHKICIFENTFWFGELHRKIRISADFESLLYFGLRVVSGNAAFGRFALKCKVNWISPTCPFLYVTKMEPSAFHEREALTFLGHPLAEVRNKCQGGGNTQNSPMKGEHDHGYQMLSVCWNPQPMDWPCFPSRLLPCSLMEWLLIVPVEGESTLWNAHFWEVHLAPSLPIFLVGNKAGLFEQLFEA